MNEENYHDEENRSYGYGYSAITEEELERLKQRRKERYTDEYTYHPEKKEEKPVNKYVMFGLLFLIFAYFIVSFVLNLTGVIDKLTMLIMLAPVVLIMLVIYLVRKNRH